jgi:hypothetical protein
MKPHSRREFLADVGHGMLVATMGAAAAAELGLIPAAFADEKASRLSFGSLEPLAGLLQDTPADKLQPILVKKIQEGTSLRDLVAAGALANARQCGGHDYDGFHTFMALMPAYEMSRELPETRRALPILKVLYRNAAIMQRRGGADHEILKPVEPGTLPEGRPGGELLHEAMKKKDMAAADATFAALARRKPEDAYNDLQPLVEDAVDVHRVALAWRAWETLDLTGKEHAHTLLRQSVHYCVDMEGRGDNFRGTRGIRQVLPKLLDQYKLAGRSPGTHRPDDAWIANLSHTIYAASREQAADAVAAALAEGMDIEAVGEAIALAANQLLLGDEGRVQAVGSKSKHSVHGDSPGVHASDAANAWRHIARVSNARNAMASLIVGAYHVAEQAGQPAGTGANGGQRKELYPLAEHLAKVEGKDGAALLREVEAAIRNRDQALACAAVHRYGELGQPPRAVFDLLLTYAISEDGALHAEKYYRTASEEFAALRPAFRWRQLVALARVTASEFGTAAPGYAEACRLLKT